MAFKSNKQRKCVMAILRNNGFSERSAKFICNKNPGITSAKIEKMSYKQLQKRGIKISPFKDSDHDGIINMKDCKPLDKKRQGIIHDFIKKKNEFVKRRNKKLEQKQDALLKEIDNEKTKLAKTRVVQKRIMENQKLKEELSSLKKANFAQTRTGKIIAATTSPKAKKAACKFLKKIFN